ncbi:MAG: hypothetical protein ACXWA3_12665 [Acidimicrobiales bacterium]
MSTHAARRPLRLLVVAFLLGSILAIGAAQSASAATATITSAGPLTNIGISSDLNCSVNHTGDSSGEFYGNTACGTLVALAGTLYGPASIPAGSSAAPRTTYTPVSQSAVTGSGTSASPFSVTTVVDLGGTGFQLTETDTYVVGQEAYLTTVAIKNNSGAAQSAIIYRAGDCYLQDSDEGLGQVDGGAVACKAPTGDRIEQWFPITPGSSYMEDDFDTVWAKIGSQQPFANTCTCTEELDNGAGLSWTKSIAPGQSTSVQHYTTFSPLGIQPLTVGVTADAAQAAPGAADGYTITVTNPGSTAVTLDSVTDTLAAGFHYTVGTTTGGVTTDPTVAGQVLTWNGPLNVPANGALTFHIGVTVSTTNGTYTNSADATGEGLILIGASGVAPITVGVTAPTTPVTAPPAQETQTAPAFTG